MSARAGTPEPRLFFLSRGGADADVALAVARILQEAGQRTILQDEDLTHQDFMAAMERAFSEGDQGAVTVAFLSAGYQGSPECQEELLLAAAAFEGGRGRLVGFRVGELPVDQGTSLAKDVDLVAALSIEDDTRRSLVFARTVLVALDLPAPNAEFDREDAVGGGSVTQDDMARVAEALDGDPMALRLASSLLAERPGARVETYLEALAEHGAALPGRRAYPPQRRAAVLTSFEVVEGDAAMRGQSATSLLALAACAPEGVVPASAFDERPDAFPPEFAPFAADGVLRAQALDLLERLSLLTRTGTTGGYAVEPDIQVIVRDLLTEAGRVDEWTAAAARLTVDPARMARAAAQEPVATAPKEQPPLSESVPSSVAFELREMPPSRDAALAAFERGEALAKNGAASEALQAFEAARAIFQNLCDASPGDIQAEADLAASHAKIGLTYIGAGYAGEGERWLKSCRGLIARLASREPGNELWPRYLESLDAQLTDIARAKSPPPAPPKPATPQASGGDTVRRLVNALKEPSNDPLDPPTEALNAEEPPPLVIDATRAPPKVFSNVEDEPVALQTEMAAVKSKRRILPLAVNGHGYDGPNGHGSPQSDAIDPAPESLVPSRKTGFLKRLFGR